MKNKWYVVLVSLVLVSTLAACSGGVVPGKTDNLRTLYVTGKGEVYLVPDIAYIYIGVRSQADTVSDALTANNAQAQSIASALKGFGVEDKDIQTTAFNVYPVQDYSPEGQVTRTYYVVENTIFTKVRNLQKLGEILDSVVRAGANNINGISFDVENRMDAETQARKLAVEDARRKAQELAEASGVALAELQSINVYSSGTPTQVSMYEGKGGTMASSTVPIAPGQMVVIAEANLTYIIK